jgi:hypothetical protein
VPALADDQTFVKQRASGSVYVLRCYHTHRVLYLRSITVRHSAPRARAAALSEIDDQIDIAGRLARSLLVHRNAFAPIFVLPPELLLLIFRAHALAEPPWWSDAQTQKLGWIRVTHVCRHWRQVALNDSLLWAKISGFPTSTEWISETLDRAGNALLVVDLSGAPGRETLSIFSSHFSHTREFRLRTLSLRHIDSIRGICDQEAPALEHFELGLAIASPIAFQRLVRTTFFKGRAPKLRTFSFSQVVIPWSLIPRGQLTQLKITLIDETPTPLVGDSRQLVDLLIDCPALEILVLEFCLPSGLMQFSHGKAIHLPRLSRLCLGGSCSRVAGLLNMLRPASSTTLHLCCIPEITLPHSVYLILPLVSAQFHDPAPVEFKGFRIILNYSEPSMVIIASTAYTTLKTCPSDLSEGGMDGDVELALSFEGLRMRRHWADILERACSTLPISNLEFLSICAPHAIPVANWGGLFQRCTELGTIRACGHGTSTLLRALDPPKGAILPIFPKLTTLFLRKLDFSQAVPNEGSLYDVLSRALQWRRTHGELPLKRLGIDRSIISAEHANALGRLVQEFGWSFERGILDRFDKLNHDSPSNSMGREAQREGLFTATTRTELAVWE